MIESGSENLIRNAMLVLPCEDLDQNLKFFEVNGFQLESIFPADDPREAVLSGFGLRLLLERTESESGPVSTIIRIAGDRFGEVNAPCGALLVFEDRNRELAVPKPDSSFLINRSNDESEWVQGRAGMRYRDLIPGRLGGYLIASHIHIRDGGPVPDYVHFHEIVFQIIYCRNGWARLVYEDQGDPFVFEAGDCVLQPPGIRHRVLESSENLEVIEVSCPAEHVTFKDNEMDLPNGVVNADRLFGGQPFVWSRLPEASCYDLPDSGMQCRDTGISEATNEKVSVRVLRPSAATENEFRFQSNGITVVFVLSGSCLLRIEGDHNVELKVEDTITIPCNTRYVFEENSEDLELLEIGIGPDS